MNVLWTESALSQLDAIYEYIAQTSPEYALRMIDRLTRRSIQIAEFPFSGRMVPEYESNEVREVLAHERRSDKENKTFSERKEQFLATARAGKS